MGDRQNNSGGSCLLNADRNSVANRSVATPVPEYLLRTPNKTGTGSEPAQQIRCNVKDWEVPVPVLLGPPNHFRRVARNYRNRSASARPRASLRQTPTGSPLLNAVVGLLHCQTLLPLSPSAISALSLFPCAILLSPDRTE
jgi:hypothetical protein